MRLKNKVAIVTGGGVGIGRAYCLGLAKEGASVVVADIQEAEAKRVEEEIRREGGEAFAVAVDVTSAEKTRAMAEAALRKYGRIDILVNNAALCSAIKKNRSPKSAKKNGQSDGGERQGFVSLRASGLCRDEAAKERQDHQHPFRHGARRHAVLSPLRDFEGGRDRLHPRPRARIGVR